MLGDLEDLTGDALLAPPCDVTFQTHLLVSNILVAQVPQ